MRKRLLIALSCVLAGASAGIAAPSKPIELPVVRKLVLRNLLPSEVAKTIGGVKASVDSKTKKVSLPPGALTMDAKNETHTLTLRGSEKAVAEAADIITQLDANPVMSLRFLVRLLRVPTIDGGTPSETTLAAETVDAVSGKDILLTLPCDVNMKTSYQETQPHLPPPQVSTKYQIVIVPHLMPAVKRAAFGVNSACITTTVLQPLRQTKQVLPNRHRDEAVYNYYGSTQIGTAYRSTLYLEPLATNSKEQFKHVLEITPLPAVSNSSD